jgi:hypothetical protein
MIFKTLATTHPVTQCKKALINCVFVRLSNYLRQDLTTQNKSAIYVNVLYQYYLNVLHSGINMNVRPLLGVYIRQTLERTVGCLLAVFLASVR